MHGEMEKIVTVLTGNLNYQTAGGSKAKLDVLEDLHSQILLIKVV